jgi:hypothetical protein
MNSLRTMVSSVQDKVLAWWTHADQPTPCLLFTGPVENPQAMLDTDDLERYWFSADEVVERSLRTLENRHYYGVALPFHWPDWGASTFAGLLGANMAMAGKETFWAHPCCQTLAEVLSVDVQPQSRFSRAVLDVVRRSVALSADRYFVAAYPMVGIGDILAGLYGTVPLLTAMVEDPGGVKKAMAHVRHLWLREFDRVQAQIESAGNPGNMNWMSIWAPGRTCATQEDMSCMISDRMFREFCLPPLVDLIDSLDYAMYHLDGPGALGHLDTLLAITHLRAIQWVPGAGREGISQWYDLIRHILAKGKSVQVFARLNEIDDLVKNVGARGLLIHTRASSPQEAEALLERYPQVA